MTKEKIQETLLKLISMSFFTMLASETKETGFQQLQMDERWISVLVQILTDRH